MVVNKTNHPKTPIVHLSFHGGKTSAGQHLHIYNAKDNLDRHIHA